ncbi:leucine-rich repeat domain-containing protein [Chitinophaga pinensis]|uniref:Leucine-rich repeat domain-containing protein n=1 Tax=Chitinophaga pinensis TaxID=79329 RepID=A0A5C6LVJ5_9BACT|nr:leucine-rich repeat domain-containing protein [Chitinophaga pinensis]TWW00598.1 leucine-rich repeat domain-containing protein [Chitinophaga pinensis]
MKTSTPKIVSFSTIREQFDVSHYDLINCIDEGNVILFDGNTHIDGDLDTNRAETFCEDPVLVFVNGDLTVTGDIAMGDSYPSLMVLGNVHCDVLYSGDEMIHITGNATVKYAFYGYYNHGSITVEGKTYVPYVLNADHASGITPEGAVLINLYSDHNDFFDYDYTSKDLATAMVKPALDKNGEADAWNIIGLLRKGKSPFKKNIKPPREVYEEQLRKLTGNNPEAVTELDLTEKKLKAFPKSLALLSNLRKLILSKNEIQEIPDEIGALTQLEELYLVNCDLQKISAAIGQLTNLRILDISGNYELRQLPESFKSLANLRTLKADHVGLELPETYILPANLEEISFYSAYKDLNKFFAFPYAILQLKHLKVLDLRENYFTELPPAFDQLPSLETFLWTGSRTNATVFPDFTKLKTLKKLVISRKLLSWKKEVFNIPTLEHLEIDRHKEQKEYFDEATLQIWQEMAQEDPEEYRHLQKIMDNKKQEADGKFSCIISPGITPEDVQDINKLPGLKYLDLSFNELPYLPETIYELKALEYLDLRYNKFSEEEKEKIMQGFPATKIVF